MSLFELIAKKTLTSSVFFKFILICKSECNESYLEIFIKVISNPFISEFDKKVFIDHFQKIKKICMILKRFVFLIKFNKALLVVNQDLNFNVLDVKNNKVLCLYHCKSKYLFHLNDLNKCINASLLHGTKFTNNPIIIKNPYNNVPFTISNLYNIYIFMKKNNVYNTLFHHYCYCNFNLNEFKQKCRNILKEKIINHYIQFSQENELCSEIKIMIAYFNRYFTDNKKTIMIDDSFPKKILVETMKPFLYLYIMSHHASTFTLKSINKDLFILKMNTFYLSNPHFGRKIIKIHGFNDKFKKKYIKFVTYNSLTE